MIRAAATGLLAIATTLGVHGSPVMVLTGAEPVPQNLKVVRPEKVPTRTEIAGLTKSMYPVHKIVRKPASSRSYARSKALSKYGWGKKQFKCLNSIWNAESNWRHNADNPNSSAYGIPQALPGKKMAIIADDWKTNPQTQIKWGLKYIDERYGSPCEAWDFWQRNGWY